MTLFGKILIGLILALSLVFASLSAAVYSAQFNYRKELETQKDQYATLETRLKDREEELLKQIGDIEAELAKVTDERDLQTQTATQLAQQNQLLQGELATTNTALNVQTADTEIAQAEAEDRRVEVLAGRQRTADLSEKFVASEGEIAALTDEAFSQSVTITQMAQTNGRLLDEVASLRAQLREIGIAPNSAFTGTDPAPDVSGKITAVDERGSAGTKVAISVGSDDGLREGDELEVVRMTGGGKYIGKIRLVEVGYDSAIGNLISKNPTATVKEGDDVKTRL
ncbi:hypothetical protein [Alienimonas californiensis]|uniref:Uncharacterized protein n=1 Tax=Alienimonas californiensis TaxID=2527989 RepID=A0A517PC04_9PLAN|nr:hypothetical protein [Alienimonas californiensis]QDT16898.1 hypothetical protein CA12_30060 [Alienimonas californiensis]